MGDIKVSHFIYLWLKLYTMNIREMHIELNQSLQKVAANKTRKYLNEELDWVLNKIQNRFIQSKLKPRKGGAFSIDQLEIDAIRPILIQTKLPAYIDVNYKNRYEVYLPTNYSYLISDSSYLSDLCGMSTEPQVSDAKIYLTWLKQIYTTKTAPAYYETTQLVVDGTNTLNIPSDLPYSNTYVGYNRKEDISFNTRWITHTLNQSLRDIQTGFETYAKKYKPNNFVFVSTDHQLAASLTLDGISSTLITQEILNVKQHVSQSNEELTANRLESSEHIPQMLGTAFYKPTTHSPISELIGNVLYIYSDNNFTVNSSYITYVRKPQPMSLALGSDCELAPEFHQTICDLATEYIKGRLENKEGMQLVEKDNEQRVIL